MTPPARPRSSTAPSQASPHAALEDDLQPLIVTLQHSFSEDADAVRLVAHWSCNLQHIRQILVDSPHPSGKDVFRRLRGFEALLDVLDQAAGPHQSNGLPKAGISGCLDLVKAVLVVLAEALDGHAGNRRYFSERVERLGWTRLERSLSSVRAAIANRDHGLFDTHGCELLFGHLFSFALKDDTLESVFGDLRRLREQDEGRHDTSRAAANEATARDAGSRSAPEMQLTPSVEPLELLEGNLARFISYRSLLRNPEILPTILRLWKDSFQSARDEITAVPYLSLSILVALLEVVSASKCNLAAATSTEMMSIILPYVQDRPPSTKQDIAIRGIADTLISQGLRRMQDVYSLFRSATRSAEAATLLLGAIRSSRQPPHFQFDMSLHGFSSLELPTLNRCFPPTSSSAGYSFATWIHIDAFDPKVHTTVFGAFDASQTCFVMAYIEKDTHNFILQTSVTSSKPSVRFRSRAFQEGRWYHIVIAHSRPRTTSSSKAALFIDGEVVEQLQCHYPANQPLLNSGTESFASLSSSQKRHAPVQAFLGTPRDLSARIGPGVSSLRWSLASFHLFEEILTLDLVAVFYHLGPRYNGNFQDCLGSFQTYEASAALNVRNESMHPGKAENSILMSAIRSKAGSILPEHRILLSVFASAAVSMGSNSDFRESTLIRSLSRRSAGKLHHLTHSGNDIFVNGAVPSINTALAQPHGVAVTAGESVLLSPSPLDEMSWRIGGSVAVGLKLVEVADTRESLVRAVTILLECVQDNWRNSEAMERENAFGILGLLIGKKLGVTSTAPNKGPGPVEGGPSEWQKLGLELLSVILRFLGFKRDQRDQSIIINPLAYRILLVDLDVWRKTAPTTQKLYFDQFLAFANESKHRQFNSTRLFKMRTVKKVLDSLKGVSVHEEVVSEFRSAFLALLTFSSSGEVFRTLSLFITYALSRGRRSEPLTSSADVKHTRVSSPLSGTSKDNSFQPSSIAADATTSSRSLSYTELAQLMLDIYVELLCRDIDETNIKKFARTVTNKWLLHLLADDDPSIVSSGLRILVRLLVSQGGSYVSKFAQKTNGFLIAKHNLTRWWRNPTIWSMLFGMLFGSDFADLGGQEPTLDMISTRFIASSKAKILYPEVLPVLCAMLGAGLKDSSHDRQHRNRSRSGSKDIDSFGPIQALPHRGETSKASTKGLVPEEVPRHGNEHGGNVIEQVLETLISLHTNSQPFRDFAVSSDYVRELLSLLYSVLLSSESITAEAELHLRDSAWLDTGTGSPYPRKRGFSMPPPTDHAAQRTRSQSGDHRPQPTLRASSFVLISSDLTGSTSASSEKSVLQVLDPGAVFSQTISSESSLLLDLSIRVFLDQMFGRKEFTGFGVYNKIPPGTPENVALFESFILKTVVMRIRGHILDHLDILSEPRTINNMATVMSQLGDAMVEGWLAGGADLTLDFAGTVIECLQKPDMAKKKTVRLCSQVISMMKSVFLRAVLFQLSEPESGDADGEQTVAFLNRVLYWQNIAFDADTVRPDQLPLVWFLLYGKLVGSREKVRVAVVNFWRLMLMHMPSATSHIQSHVTDSTGKSLLAGFNQLKGMDDGTFLDWIASHREQLDSLLFSHPLAATWADFGASENKRIELIAVTRADGRKERLKQWAMEDSTMQTILHSHEMTCYHMAMNIYAAERLKQQRVTQDHQDNAAFLISSYKRLELNLKGPCPLFETEHPQKWRLDQTEGRNRMRARLLPDTNPSDQEYQPKGRQSQVAADNTRPRSGTGPSTPKSRHVGEHQKSLLGQLVTESPALGTEIATTAEPVELSAVLGDEFEMVDDPRADGEAFEDKNRRVVRSLQRGDQIQHVYNVSRIVGLEASEGLLVLGKDCLYLMDDFFQRSDGEIVGVSQAPKDERDPYVRMISGRQSEDSRSAKPDYHRGSRHWTWTEVISISKRRFLFRDVAIEVFFTDGRSYLLTSISPSERNDLYAKLTEKAPHVHGGSSLPFPENRWRLETLRSPEEDPQTFGSRIANVFTSGHQFSATRKWLRGEISNFHYLMLVNTMAGRTFNDLTQYPVFPWVLADYSSEELDLTNPKSFRDLSKPMGAQNPQREAEFDGRYKVFAEMADHNAPPFHYGTHYSSAMIVTSYLVRLQPFVQSFLLLQGGSFDHADRMFHSIEQAWTSASREHMTDVRELIPEFFYLPEFLENLNEYNFGLRQKTGTSIDSVALPRWAKGDPKVFIAKHRRALESEHVSQNLHQWIDLVFGFKQQGEAAIRATNVFHHLSYHGAKDLDTIEDPVERLATIGIIHNFGQTPHQVFQRPHPPRDIAKNKRKTLDAMAETLTRLPLPLLESEDRVASLVFSHKHDRLLCAAPFRLNIPPDYDKYVEWGFVDDSVRFYQAESRKLLGLFEHMHQKQLSCAVFADSKTLITAGLDCTVAVWTMTTGAKAVDLQPRTTLFGHMAPVTVIATSKSYNALLCVSAQGQASLWDLNRLIFVRNLPAQDPVECARINDVNGDIVLCHRQSVAMYTLNGQQILTQQVCGASDDKDDCISSCAFYEGVGNEWLERELLLTGHKRGVVNIWDKTVDEKAGCFKLCLIKRLDHIHVTPGPPPAPAPPSLSMLSTSTSQRQPLRPAFKSASPASRGGGRGGAHGTTSNNISARITCILPMVQTLYTGDDEGRVYEWNCMHAAF